MLFVPSSVGLAKAVAGQMQVLFGGVVAWKGLGALIYTTGGVTPPTGVFPDGFTT